MSSNSRTVAEVLVEILKEAGVEVVFGLPGGENVEVMEALRQEGIRFVLVRNESSAVFMADVHTRLSGKPGVCLTTLGPGATNAYVGLAHAYLDRAPVMLITAETNQRYLPHHTHQVYNLQDIFRPVTKLTASLTPENVQNTVRDALSVMRKGRPGPVHLSLSREMAAQVAQVADVAEIHDEMSAQSLLDLTAAREVLADTMRPVMVVGLGLEPEQPYEALRMLAEAANAPVIVTPKGKGSLLDSHPLCAGTLGLTRTDPVYEILQEADCILAIGFDVVELVKPWDETASLIWIAPWANEDPTIPAAAEFVGPMRPILERLSDLAFRMDNQSTWGAARVAALREKLAQQPLPTPQAGRLLPQTVLHSLREHLPDDTLITTDVGSHKICTALNWPALAPNRYMLSNGLSAMSFGLTGAIAGAITLQQPTVCITGDAGFGMIIGELSLLTEHHLPVIVVVMNDSALDLIRAAQHRAGHPTFGTEFTNPNFSKIADAYDLAFYQVTDDASCAHAIENALRAGGPVLIEALIDPVSYPTTPK